VAASLLVGVLFGNGLARTSIDLSDGVTWLKDEPSGKVLQVNPVTGEPMGALDVGAAGDPLQLAQYDGGLVVLNRKTGTITSFDLATILRTGQSRVKNGDQVELLTHDDRFFRLDKQEGTFAAIDTVTTRPMGEIWYSPTGLIDAKIDEHGTVWALDPEGLVTALTWSPESEAFIVEDTRQVDHSGPGSVLVAHERGVTLFGPDNGIVVQVGTGRDIVQGGLDLTGHLAGPAASPDDLVPVSSPDNAVLTMVSGQQIIQVPLAGACTHPGRPLAYHASVYVPCPEESTVLRLSPDGKMIGSIHTPKDGTDIELVVDDGYLLINVQGSDTGIRVLPNGDTETFKRRGRDTPVTDGAKGKSDVPFSGNATDDRRRGRDREPPSTTTLPEPPIKILPHRSDDTDRRDGGRHPGREPGNGDHDGLAAPSSVVATVESGRVVIRWSHSGEPSARTFEIRETGGARVGVVRNSQRRELALDIAVPTTPTTWTVTAVRGGDRAESAPSNEIPKDTSPPELAAPANVLASAEDGGTVRISWAHEGDIAAESFAVKRSDGTVVADDLEADDRDVVDDDAPLGRPVSYVVTAVNGKDRAASAASNTVTPARAPDPVTAPTNVRATAMGDGTVRVTWAHSGTAAGQFTVATGGGADVTPSAGLSGGARSATVSVPLGTPVDFRVTAVNGSERATSTASNTVTPARDPDPLTAPGRPTATAQSNGTVRVTWTHSGTAASEFVVRTGGSEVARTNGTEREAVVSGIAPGTPTTFTVTAVLGSQSQTSAASNAVTTAAAPGAPSNVRVTVTGSGSGGTYRLTVTATWGAATANGSPISQYAVRISGGLGQKSSTTSASGRSATATFTCSTSSSSCGDPADAYTATVNATNAYGTGAAGTGRSSVPAPPRAGAPGGMAASGSMGGGTNADRTCTITATWGAADGKGWPITGYEATRNDWTTSQNLGASARSATWTFDCRAGLGTRSYTVKVRARTSRGTGTEGTTSTTINHGPKWHCWPDRDPGPGRLCP